MVIDEKSAGAFFAKTSSTRRSSAKLLSVATLVLPLALSISVRSACADATPAADANAATQSAPAAAPAAAPGAPPATATAPVAGTAAGTPNATQAAPGATPAPGTTPAAAGTPAAGTTTPATPAADDPVKAKADAEAKAKADKDKLQSVTLIRHANKAADQYNTGDYARAKEEFRMCISLSPKNPEFYEGLYQTCMKSGDWDQVIFALEKMFELEPSLKDKLAYEYGLALFKTNKYDDSAFYLKKALATADKPTPPYHPKTRSVDIVPTTRVAYTPPPPPPTIKKYERRGPTEKEQQQFSLSYDNAITSESILLVTYEGFDNDDVHWNHPPTAHYHIDTVLKGPPLNRALPVRYEFHDNVNKAIPKGWDFKSSMMPEKGSKWILFIEFAVPKRGAFETYQGSYGRQEPTEDNLNKLYQLMDAHNMREQH